VRAPFVKIDAALDDPAFFEPPSANVGWRLRLDNGPDGSQTLWLSCFKPGTLFLVK
jgi:hypothetical protein